MAVDAPNSRELKHQAVKRFHGKVIGGPDDQPQGRDLALPLNRTSLFRSTPAVEDRVVSSCGESPQPADHGKRFADASRLPCLPVLNEGLALDRIKLGNLRILLVGIALHMRGRHLLKSSPLAAFLLRQFAEQVEESPAFACRLEVASQLVDFRPRVQPSCQLRRFSNHGLDVRWRVDQDSWRAEGAPTPAASARREPR